MRRLTPFLLVGVLVLGTGLGIGLGLSEEPPSITRGSSGVRAEVVSVRPARNRTIEWVTLRLPFNRRASYSCSVVLRHNGLVVGRSGFTGSLPGDGIALPIKLTGRAFVGTSSDVTAVCTSALIEPIGTAPTPTTSPSAPPTTAPYIAAPTCAASQLNIQSDAGGWHGNYAATGTFAEWIFITNTSATECSLGGWPTVQEVLGSPVPTEDELVTQTASAPDWSRVDLPTGGHAVFRVFGSDWNAAENTSCPETTAYLVTLPDVDSQFSIVAEEPACPYALSVAPVISGTVDDLAWTTQVESVQLGGG